MATVLQTVTAWVNGNPLPSSTGQIIDQSQADQVIATNKRLAATLGYPVNPDGSFTAGCATIHDQPQLKR